MKVLLFILLGLSFQVQAVSEEKVRMNLEKFCAEKISDDKILFSKKTLKYLEKMGRGPYTLKCMLQLKEHVDKQETKKTELKNKLSARLDLTNKAIADDKKEIIPPWSLRRDSPPVTHEQIVEYLNAPVSNYCDGLDLSGNPDVLLRELPLLKSGLKTDCKIQLIRNISYKKSELDRVLEDAQKDCDDYPVDICRTTKKKSDDYQLALNEIFSSVANKLGLDSEKLCEELKVAPSLDIWLDQFSETLTCRDSKSLKPGQTLVVDSSVSYDFPTGIPANYALRKEADNSTSVIVNIDFKIKDAGASKEDFITKAKACYQEYSPYMRGPDQQKLNFVLMTPEEVQSLPVDDRMPAIEVNVSQDQDRDNASNYNSKIDCSTIVHEGLHLLGLVDEYEERDPALGFSCRAHPKTNTIMAKNREYPFDLQAASCKCEAGSECSKIMSGDEPFLKKAYLHLTNWAIFPRDAKNLKCEINDKKEMSLDDVKAQFPDFPITKTESGSLGIFQLTEIKNGVFIGQINSCTFNPEDTQRFAASIRQVFNQPKGVTCPMGADFIKREFVAPEKFGTTNFANGILTVNPPNNFNGGLLAPAHFERIMGGNCKDKAQHYNECAKWAYKKKNCEEKPSSCSDENYYLGISQ